MNLLVVGGAGYIGSHMVKKLIQQGHGVTVLDNLATGHAAAVNREARFVRGDLSDGALLGELLNEGCDAVFHFAASSLVGESEQSPAKYYRNNICHTLNLLDAMVEARVGRLVFSSTAAIFGDPTAIPIRENAVTTPNNVYGRTKLMVEQILADYDRAYGLKSVCLRYFNAAGADPDGDLGEEHDPETHLIPLVLQAASGRRAELTLFGADYDTPDGTCIRDYIHVSDLCDAHLLALDRLCRTGRSEAFNLGNGRGFSVREVIEVAREVTGVEIPVRYAGRRAGDTPILVADAAEAIARLGWTPRFPRLHTIVEHAWRWELKLKSDSARERATA